MPPSRRPWPTATASCAANAAAASGSLTSAASIRRRKGRRGLLAFDITDRELAEQSRREFTANVSHELKTPLQGIIGSAELLESGMVKEEDVPRFVGHIRDEAQRLVTLIGDIIRLSQLDEGVDVPREPVDLLAVANEAAHDLQGAAEARKVTLTVDGERAQIVGCAPPPL